MNYKFTDFMIGILIGILVLTVVISMVIIIKKDNKTEKNVDHTLVQIDKVDGPYSNCTVYYDKDTRVMYIVNYHGGITVMVNPDGSPRLYKEDNDG